MNTRRNALLLSVSWVLASAGCAGDGGDPSTAVAEIRGASHAGRFAARGLLGRDAQTQFDTTTGTFDTSTPPGGDIAQLQLTVFNDNGTVRFTRAYEHLDPIGAYSFVLNGLARGTQFQIDASVSPGRPDPLTSVQVSDIVRLRPDVIVGPDRVRIVGPDRPGIVGPDRFHIVGPDRFHIVGPDHTIVGPDHILIDQPVRVAALLREVNGDVDAIVDCVLSVDGSVVSTQPDFTVSAGSRTLCGFNTVFHTLGTHSVTIGAANVKPSDFDPSNNSYTFDVQIVGPDRTHGNGHGRGGGNSGNGNGNGG